MTTTPGCVLTSRGGSPCPKNAKLLRQVPKALPSDLRAIDVCICTRCLGHGLESWLDRPPLLWLHGSLAIPMRTWLAAWAVAPRRVMWELPYNGKAAHARLRRGSGTMDDDGQVAERIALLGGSNLHAEVCRLCHEEEALRWEAIDSLIRLMNLDFTGGSGAQREVVKRVHASIVGLVRGWDPWPSKDLLLLDLSQVTPTSP